jgi:signal peptidase II
LVKIRFFTIALITIFIDQISKYWVYRSRPDWTSNWLHIHLIKNTGAGFGILPNQTILLGLISLIVAIGIIVNYQKIEKEKFPQFLWALLLGGIIGNMLDRFFRRFVIDFIDLGFWPAFNVADSAITLSTLALIFYYWKK